MRIEPMKAYVCEYCGRQFTNSSDCDEHEIECKLWKHREICPECRGTKKVFSGYTCGSYLGFGNYEKVKKYDTCYKCNGRGWIYA